MGVRLVSNMKHFSYLSLEDGFIPTWLIIEGAAPEVYSWESGWIDFRLKPKVFLPPNHRFIEIPEFELTGSKTEVYKSLKKEFLNRDGYYMIVERGEPFIYQGIFSLLIGIAYHDKPFINELWYKPVQPINNTLPAWLGPFIYE